MVLNYLGIKFRYRRLLLVLKIESHGAPFSNLRFLESVYPVQVEVRQGDLAELASAINANHAPVIFVNTWGFENWDIDTNHWRFADEKK